MNILKQEKEITNFNNVKIPEKFSMIKLVTYNIELKNSISLRTHINKIVQYIFNEFRNKVIDIACIQGINDKYAIYELILSIKKVCKNNNVQMYYAPNFDHIELSDKSQMVASFNASWYGNKESTSTSNNISTNIIISKYPIINYIFNELNKGNSKIFTSNDIIAANISINNNIISIYNVSLCEDINGANISNRECRNSELDKVKNIIIANQHDLINNVKFNKYNKTDINFLVGSLEIPETSFGIVNQEYIDLTEKFHCVDIYRLLTTNDGITTKNNRRTDYIMLLMTEDIFNEKSDFHKLLMKVENSNDLLQLVFKRYTYHTLQAFVNTKIDNRNNYPVENIFIFKTL